MKCYRCGLCCRGFFCAIPKTKTSNLDPSFLSTMTDEELEKYLEENADFTGSTLEKCKWLDDSNPAKTVCLVYNQRSQHCREYGNDLFECKLGKRYTELRLERCLHSSKPTKTTSKT